MQLTPYDREVLTIGHMLNFPVETAKVVLPGLTHDKFIYNKEGGLGVRPDHMYIWQAIQNCVMQRRNISIPTILELLPSEVRENYRAYLITMQDKLGMYYRIHEFDLRLVRGLADAVDKAGVLYRIAAKAERLSTVLDEQARFEKTVEEIDDIDAWANMVLTEFRTDARPADVHYQPISSFADKALEQLYRIEQGEQSMLIPCGIRAISEAGLFPLQNLTTIHGMSGGGKSALLFAVCVGTAMTLVSRGIKGCVAFNSLEMDGAKLVMRAAASLAGFDTKLLYGSDYQGPTYESFKRWIPIVGSLPIYIDPTKFAEVSAVEYNLDSLHTSEHGPVWWMGVDYLELHGGKNERVNKEQWLDQIIHNYFQLSRTTGAAVVMLSQSTYGDGSNRYRIAGPGGVRYSQAIRHAADVIVELWNPIYMKAAGIPFDVPDGLDEHHLYLLLQKYRDSAVGTHIRLGWEPQYTRVWDVNAADDVFGDEVIFDHLKETVAALSGGGF